MVGLKSGLSYSLREQHQTYIDMFKEIKCIMGESSKAMIETSSSLSETLKSENKESGKTLSSLKEVLGTAHELTKTLVEGKTHGHLQIPTAPPSKSSSEKKGKPTGKTESKWSWQS